MSARFIANLVILIIGAGLLVALFAFSFAPAHWIALGVGAVAILMALYSFASAHQGIYQRIADVAICGLGVWAAVAAVVMMVPPLLLGFEAAVASRTVFLAPAIAQAPPALIRGFGGFPSFG